MNRILRSNSSPSSADGIAAYWLIQECSFKNVSVVEQLQFDVYYQHIKIFIRLLSLCCVSKIILFYLIIAYYHYFLAGYVNAQASLSMTLEGQPVTDGQDVLLTGGGDYTFQCIHSESADIMWLLGNKQKTADSENRLTLRNVFLECGLELVCFSGTLSVTVIIKIAGKY